MKHAIILVRLHGEENFEVESGREVPIQEQIRRFKGLLGSRTHPVVAEAELWYSDGTPARKAKFSLPLAESEEKPDEQNPGGEPPDDASAEGVNRAVSQRKPKIKA